MNTTNWKTYFAGLSIYAVCITLAALPIFSAGLSLQGLGELCGAAAVASLFVAVFRLSRAAEYLRDKSGAFTQAVLGIAVCSGLYSLVSDARPEVMFMVFLLWTAVGLLYLTPQRVVALFALHTGIYVNEFSSSMFIATGTQAHAETLFMLLTSALMAGFMCWRARDYTRVRKEKSQLRDENSRQAAEIGEAKERIHKLTVQDMDTIALKYPFFKEELRRCKEQADRSGTTFSVGLIALDHFSALGERYGELVIKQLMREVVERAGKVISKMGLEDAGDGGHHPLGRVGDGLFGVILPRANMKGAQTCAQQLHNAIELQSIRTMAGLVNVTLTVGIAEYYPGESVDELMELVGRSLEKARLQDAEELQAIARQQGPKPAPVKAARTMNELRLLHEKEYESQLH